MAGSSPPALFRNCVTIVSCAISISAIHRRRREMSLKLRKVSRGPHLPTLVASSITREIAQGRLRPGDQLPTEQALATTFGVSRNVVREAIARLRSERG